MEKGLWLGEARPLKRPKMLEWLAAQGISPAAISGIRRLARLLELEPNDPAVVAAFDALVLRGDLKPFVPDWWELSRQLAAKLAATAQGPAEPGPGARG